MGSHQMWISTEHMVAYWDHIKCGSLQSVWWPNGITSNVDLYRAYGGLMGSHQMWISTEHMVA